MILFPLMTAWMCLQIFKASPLPHRVVENGGNAEISRPPALFKGG